VAECCCTRSAARDGSISRREHTRPDGEADCADARSDGGERCVACYLCSVAARDCIALQAIRRRERKRTPRFFRINFSRCIFCGFLRRSLSDLRDSATPDSR